jgi:hypothetical protein
MKEEIEIRDVIIIEKTEEFMVLYPEIRDNEIGCTNCGSTNHIDQGDLNQFGACRCRECNSPLI